MSVVNLESIIKDLESRGLVIKDQEEFEYYVKNFNVNTFIAEYSDFFENDEHKFDQVNANDIIKLYQFDKNLGNHIFREILVIEKIINTNVVIETINYYNIEDKCMLKLEPNVLQNSILRNLDKVEPYTEYRSFLYKITKYMDGNKVTKKYLDMANHDDIFKWANTPLDVMCLTWSFATTFSFLIASSHEVREIVLKNFKIDYLHWHGFVDFVKNLINIRNHISHNIVVYDTPVKYVSNELMSLYSSIFNENVDVRRFKLIHIIRMIDYFANSKNLFTKTVQFGKSMNVAEPYRTKIAKLFEL